MLVNTFVHIPGVGYKTEQALWQHGIKDWHTLIETDFTKLNLNLKAGEERVKKYVSESVSRLKQFDYKFFASVLPRREVWRAYKEFKDKTVFLDIETTGFLGSDITLIGLYDGRVVRTFINGINIGFFEKTIRRYALIVTYNGARFDLPFINAYMPQVDLNKLHIDLRYVLKRLGYTGGLKNIEQRLGIRRPAEIAHLNGADAVALWTAYKKGDPTALDILIEYNRADTTNLKYLMEFAYEKLKQQVYETTITNL